MNGHVKLAIASLAVALPLALTAKASAATLWVCEVPG